MRTVLLLLFVVAALAPAAVLGQGDSPPHRFAGNAYLDGVLAPPGTLVEAVSGERVLASAPVALVSAAVNYRLDVPNPGGGLVNFRVGGHSAPEDSTWTQGRLSYPFDLRASSEPVPAAAPAPSPVAATARPAAVRGQAGPGGPQGPAGLPGSDGRDGVAGPPGDTGPAGPPGRQGDEGDIGPRGPVGEDGPVGPRGPAGVQGPPGARGEVGPAGPSGRDGEQGPRGPEGLTGAAGRDGADGSGGFLVWLALLVAAVGLMLAAWNAVMRVWKGGDS